MAETNPNGAVFGRLTVVSELPPATYAYGSYKRVLCRCECGGETRTRLSKLTSGHTKSCGCLQIESVVERNTTHGMTDSGSYRTWLAMNERCSAPKQSHYKYYGGRGIKVCKRWSESFEAFYSDMGDRPEGKTLDRINVDGDYSKENCRWATAKEQAGNKRKKCV